MNIIYLTGFMGSGKTTIGRELAKKLQISVIDTDEEICERTGRTIPDIFEQNGEQYFRHLESSVLQSLPTTDMIITTGGGIILNDKNRQWMNKNGKIIFLKCDFDVIWNRLLHDETRPLIINQPRSQVETLYNSRLPLYKESDYIIDVTKKSISEIVTEIIKKVKKQESGHTNYLKDN